MVRFCFPMCITHDAFRTCALCRASQSSRTHIHATDDTSLTNSGITVCCKQKVVLTDPGTNMIHRTARGRKCMIPLPTYTQYTAELTEITTRGPSRRYGMQITAITITTRRVVHELHHDALKSASSSLYKERGSCLFQLS